MNNKEKIWKRRIKATHDKPNNARFVAGELVMFSRKCNKQILIPYFLEDKKIFLSLDKERERKDNLTVSVTPAGYLQKNMPILLIENPKKVNVISKKQYGWFNSQSKNFCLITHSNKNEKYTSILIRFILNDKVYRAYLTNKNYNQELVRALSVRFEKRY